MKPWQLGDGDNTVQTDQLRQEFIYDRINRELLLAGINDPTTFAAFASYLGYGSGGCTYQDMQVAWTPTNLKLGELMGFSGDTFDNGVPPIPGITSLTFLDATRSDIIDLNAPPDLVSVSCPNLTSTTGDNGAISIYSAPALQTFSAPVLVSMTSQLDLDADTALITVDLPLLASVVSGVINFNGCTSLVALSLPSLVTASSGMRTVGCSALTTLNLPVWIPTNGCSYQFTACNLSATSVNQLLARGVANAAFVSGLIDLSGIGNAAPTGQGIIDKATLNARQAGLAITN